MLNVRKGESTRSGFPLLTVRGGGGGGAEPGGGGGGGCSDIFTHT